MTAASLARSFKRVIVLEKDDVRTEQKKELCAADVEAHVELIQVGQRISELRLPGLHDPCFTYSLLLCLFLSTLHDAKLSCLTLTVRWHD